MNSVRYDGDLLVIRIPMSFKRHSGRKVIITPEGLPGSKPSSPAQEPLVLALARAYAWQDLLDSGRYESVTELAEKLKMDRSYVARILRLALLAPDIVTAIVEGREPSGLSLERLVKGLPAAWGAQRKVLGFSR
jgi:hypothetical protein